MAITSVARCLSDLVSGMLQEMGDHRRQRIVRWTLLAAGSVAYSALLYATCLVAVYWLWGARLLDRSVVDFFNDTVFAPVHSANADGDSEICTGLMAIAHEAYGAGDDSRR